MSIPGYSVFSHGVDEREKMVIASMPPDHHSLPHCPARLFHELLSGDREDGRATWQPPGVGSEACLNGTSQGPTAEDARKDGHIRGRSK